MLTLRPSSTPVVLPLMARGVVASARYSGLVSSPPEMAVMAIVGATVSTVMLRVPA